MEGISIGVTNLQFFVKVILLVLIAETLGKNCDTLVTRTTRLTHGGYSEPRLIPHEIIHVNSKTPCSVSLCSRHNESQQIKSTEFRCETRELIRFQSCETETRDYIGLVNCRLDMESLTGLCATPSLFHLLLHDSEILRNNIETFHRTNCVSLAALSAVNTNLHLTVDIILPPDQITEVTRLQLINASLTDQDIPKNVTHQFPNLHFVDLSNNLLEDFPVIQMQCSYDQNVADNKRSKTLLKLSNNEFGLDLQDNIIPNVLILDNNNISMLGNLSTSPCLHALCITGNTLSDIDQNVFSLLPELRYLNLSINSISEVPTICSNHKTMCKLRVLDLSNNKIKTVPANSLTKLRELRLLNLAGNALSILHQKAFAKLDALEELHLEFNHLQALDSQALPRDTAFLKDVYLHHNPLNHIPASLLQLPGLRTIDLSHCMIAFDTLQETLGEIYLPSWLQSLLKEFTTHVEDINVAKEMASFRRRPYTRFINLSNNNITSIPAPVLFHAEKKETALDLEIKFRLVFVNLKLNLSSNPLSCDSNMGEFLIYMQNHSATIGDGTFQGNEYFYKEWKCSLPEEFRGTTLLSANPRFLYREDATQNCPSDCSCHLFFRNRGVMVQCENRALSDFPQSLPLRTIDLRLTNNNIRKIQPRYYNKLGLLESLNLSNNSLTEIAPSFMVSVVNLLQLSLDHNSLKTLPREITQVTSVEKFWLGNNPYICDCENLWLKTWLIENVDRVADIDNMFCRKYDNSVSQILLVTDGQFICQPKKSKTFYLITMSVVTVMVCVILSGLFIYIYRLELRSLVYSWHRVRVLDRQRNPTHQETLKTLVIAAEEDMAFCENQVLTVLKQYVTNDPVVLFRDCVAGRTHGDNISHMLKHSYKIVVIISESLLKDEWCVLALHKALLKARRNPDCLVLLTLDHPDPVRVNSLSELKRFYKYKRYYCLTSANRLWKKKLGYLCSVPDHTSGVSTEHNWEEISLLPVAERTRACTHDIFIAHHDSDYRWAINELRVKLENSGYSTQAPDLDFTPGVDIQDNILHCVANCRYVILILSSAYIASEWAVFILRNAYETTLSENSNSLIVIKTEPLPEIEDRDLSVYLKTHAYIDLSDINWWLKLERSLCRIPSVSISSPVSPSVDDVSISVDNVSPSEVNLSPSIDSVIPSVDSVSPSVNNVSQSVDNIIPSVESVSPSVDNVGPSIDSVSTSIDSVSSSVNIVSPSVENIIPSVENVSPSVDNVGPSIDSSPSIDSVSSSVNIVSPSVDKIIPSVENVSPPVDIVSPSADSVSPYVDSVSPSVDSVSPSVDSVSPSIDSVSPSIESVILAHL